MKKKTFLISCQIPSLQPKKTNILRYNCFINFLFSIVQLSFNTNRVGLPKSLQRQEIIKNLFLLEHRSSCKDISHIQVFNIISAYCVDGIASKTFYHKSLKSTLYLIFASYITFKGIFTAPLNYLLQSCQQTFHFLLSFTRNIQKAEYYFIIHIN